MRLAEIKKELKEKDKFEKLSKKNKIALEQAWYIDAKKESEKCGRTENLTIDHIISKNIIRSFGVDIDKHFDENDLRILCFSCNQFKGNQLDFSTPKTKQLLLKYLEK